VRMIPAPTELPRVTATPKVTPRIRSKLPVEGAGLAWLVVDFVSMRRF
jgi:hypothetical protein